MRINLALLFAASGYAQDAPLPAQLLPVDDVEPAPLPDQDLPEIDSNEPAPRTMDPLASMSEESSENESNDDAGCKGPCWYMPSGGLCKPNVKSSTFKRDCLNLQCSSDAMRFTFQSKLFGDAKAYTTKASGTSYSFSSGESNTASFNNTGLGFTTERVQRRGINFIAVSLVMGDTASYSGENKDLKVFFSSNFGMKFTMTCLFTATGKITSDTSVLTGGQEMFEVEEEVNLASAVEIKILTEKEAKSPSKYTNVDLGSDKHSQAIGSYVYAGLQFTNSDLYFGAYAMDCSVIDGSRSLMVLKSQCAANGVDAKFDYIMFSPKLYHKRSLLSYKAFSWTEYKSIEYKIQCSVEFCFLGADCNSRKKSIRSNASTSINGVTCDNKSPYEYQYDNSCGTSECLGQLLVVNYNGPFLFDQAGVKAIEKRKYTITSGNARFIYVLHGYVNGNHYLFGGAYEPKSIYLLKGCMFTRLSVGFTKTTNNYQADSQVLSGSTDLAYVCFSYHSNSGVNEKSCEIWDGTKVTALSARTQYSHTYGKLGSINGNLLAVGSTRKSGTTGNEVELLSGGKWNKMASHPGTYIYYHGMVNVPEGVMTVGGYIAGVKTEIYLFNGSKWSLVGKLVKATYLNSVAPGGDHGVYFSIYYSNPEKISWNGTHATSKYFPKAIGASSHYFPQLIQVNPANCK